MIEPVHGVMATQNPLGQTSLGTSAALGGPETSQFRLVWVSPCEAQWPETRLVSRVFGSPPEEGGNDE